MGLYGAKFHIGYEVVLCKFICFGQMYV